MKLFLALSLLTVLTSAASIVPSEAQNENIDDAKFSAFNSEAIVEDFSSGKADINDILNKLKTGFSAGVIGTESSGSADPFSALFNKDHLKLMGNLLVPKAEDVAKLKEMFGTNDDFKKILDSDVAKDLFDEKLVRSFFNNGDKLSEEDSNVAHAKIDETLAKILNVPTETITKNRETAMDKLKNAENFNWDNIFDGNFANFMNSEL